MFKESQYKDQMLELGHTGTFKDLAEMHGLNGAALAYRLRERGMTLKEALAIGPSSVGRKPVLVVFKGTMIENGKKIGPPIVKTRKEWSRIMGIPEATLRGTIRRMGDDHEAITYLLGRIKNGWYDKKVKGA